MRWEGLVGGRPSCLAAWLWHIVVKKCYRSGLLVFKKRFYDMMKQDVAKNGSPGTDLTYTFLGSAWWLLQVYPVFGEALIETSSLSVRD